MKKLLLVLMALIVVLALVACGGQTDETLPQGDETEPPEGHVHAYEEVITAATCTAEGKVENKCACGDIQSTTELPLADHTPSALDCEKETVCTVCNTVLTEATGHNVTDAQVITAATCSAAGKEQGACTTCGKIVVTEIPTSGHTPAIEGAIACVDGGFSVTCKSCSQQVVLKAQEPALKLTFDTAIENESVNELGLEIFNPENWTIVDGKLQVFGKQNYINISDADKLAALDAFVISFDYMSTKEDDITKTASIISLLSNSQNGKETDKGEIGWGWFIKLVEANDTLATVNKAELTNSSNSVPVERNKSYNFQFVVLPSANVVHVFVDGTYIGNSGTMAILADQGKSNCCIRFGDTPNCGHVFDNFVIADLK